MLIKNATFAILILLVSCEVQESKNIYTSPDIPEAFNINFDSNLYTQEELNKITKLLSRILNDDVDINNKINVNFENENISKYMNLKKDWNILDKLPHKLEKTLWKKFISSGDRFFEEQNKNKQLQLDELNHVLKDLKKYEITDLQELLPKFDLINKSKTKNSSKKSILHSLAF